MMSSGTETRGINRSKQRLNRRLRKLFPNTGITTALDAGAKIEKVQAMAAHWSVETTLRYYRNKENLQDHGTDYIDY